MRPSLTNNYNILRRRMQQLLYNFSKKLYGNRNVFLNVLGEIGGRKFFFRNAQQYLSTFVDRYFTYFRRSYRFVSLRDFYGVLLAIKIANCNIIFILSQLAIFLNIIF